jgi:hypothetical protein
MPRVIATILLVAVLAIGGGIIATTAYQAGLNTAVTTAGDGATVVTPVVHTYGYGYGWHPFGWIFGFLATLFFLFVVFALLRAIFWRGGRRGGGPGWGGGGWYGYGKGPNGHGHSPWEARAHETFDDWHRHAHGDAPATGPDDKPTPTGVA